MARRDDPLPIAWTIAGSDSGGGAGIQADLKTFNAFEIHGCCVVAALTAQNTRQVRSARPIDPSFVRAQIDALLDDLPPSALKTGMLAAAGAVRAVVDLLDRTNAPLVCDPVLLSTSGTPLLDDDALRLLRDELLPRAAVVTPNLPEAERLAGRRYASPGEAAADLIGRLGLRSVLVKGGHAEGADCVDVWTDGSRTERLRGPRLNLRHAHGTGCILSAALAAGLARGASLPDALLDAKKHVERCLERPAGVGAGNGPLFIPPFPLRQRSAGGGMP